MLLDTCTFLWAVSDPAKLPPQIRALCEDPRQTLRVSVVSLFEILTKAHKGMLELPRPAHQWCMEAAEGLQANWLPLTAHHLAALEELPLLHKDPFDRLLMAQSVAERLAIVTPDEHIAQYGQVLRIPWQ